MSVAPANREYRVTQLMRSLTFPWARRGPDHSLGAAPSSNLTPYGNERQRRRVREVLPFNCPATAAAPRPSWRPLPRKRLDGVLSAPSSAHRGAMVRQKVMRCSAEASAPAAGTGS